MHPDRSQVYHPQSFGEYEDDLREGRAVPTVYHSLMEAAIADDVAPPRLVATWTWWENAWTAVSTAGLCALLWWHWGIGLVLLTLAVLGAMRMGNGLNVRLAYACLGDLDLGVWAFSKRYLSLVAVPSEQRQSCRDFNLAQIERGIDDCVRQPSSLESVGIVTTGVLFPLVRLSLSALLLWKAWGQPSWTTVGVGAPVAAFCAIQSVVRLVGMIVPLVARR